MKWPLILSAVLASACLKPFAVDALYACADDGKCSDGMTCDDGVCCRPGATPACPTLPIDGRCDGKSPDTFFEDRDNDGFGNPAVSRGFCHAPVRTTWAANDKDCDDTKNTVKPTGVEVCNGRDDNCDGVIDNGLSLSTWYLDGDHDGFGAPDASVRSCVPIPLDDGGTDYVARAGDCFPDDALAFPGSKERCNNLDDNCNGQADEGNFSDAYNEGEPADSKSCGTGLKGECAPGNTRCVRSVNTLYSLQCVPRQLPRSEVCGDALDSDCDGATDNAPGCGGPVSLAEASATFGAVRLKVPGLDTAPANLGRCLLPQYQADGGRPMSWLNPSWVTTNSLSATANDSAPYEVHLWWAEAPGDDVWDLSRANGSLELALQQNQIGAITGGFWQPASKLHQPVVNLCDKAGQLIRQYRPSNGGFVVAADLPSLKIATAGSGWDQTASNGSLDKIRRIEIVVSNRSPGLTDQTVTMTLKFAADAGFR